MVRRRERDDSLTEEQRRELLDRGTFSVLEWGKLWGPASAFRSEESKHSAWDAHAGELTEEYARKRPGQRPLAWWHWSAPGDLPRPEVPDPRDPSVGAGFPASPYGWFLAGDAQEEYLRERGLLFSHETKALEAAKSR